MATDLATATTVHRLALLLVAPQIILAVVSIVLIGLGWMDRNPFWSPTILTLSEATALRDQAAVVLLLEGGADAHSPYSIRAGLVTDREIALTPMEAAIREDRAEMAALLIENGLRVDGGQVCEWLAIAAAGDKREVLAYLRSAFSTERASCPSPAASEGR